MSLAYSPRALADLQKIVADIEPHRPSGAASVVRKIEATVELVGQYPRAGRVLSRRAAVRVLPIGKYPYRVYYQVVGDDVEILHIRHTSRRVPSAKDLK